MANVEWRNPVFSFDIRRSTIRNRVYRIHRRFVTMRYGAAKMIFVL
jgi:hypothetical protein